jgi:hypothetical protein
MFLGAIGCFNHTSVAVRREVVQLFVESYIILGEGLNPLIEKSLTQQQLKIIALYVQKRLCQ